MLSLFIYYIKKHFKEQIMFNVYHIYILYLFAIFHFIVCVYIYIYIYIIYIYIYIYIYRHYMSQRQTTFQFITLNMVIKRYYYYLLLLHDLQKLHQNVHKQPSL